MSNYWYARTSSAFLASNWNSRVFGPLGCQVIDSLSHYSLLWFAFAARTCDFPNSRQTGLKIPNPLPKFWWMLLSVSRNPHRILVVPDLENTLPDPGLIGGLLPLQPRFQINIPSINLVSKSLCHRIDGILLASTKFCQPQLFMKN